MTLQFRTRWNQVSPRFANADDAAMIALLNPDEDAIRTVLNEAKLNGGWLDPSTVNMFQAAANPRGAIASVRAGAHQLEDNGALGFQLHIGILFAGTNFHLNIQQSNSGRMYVSSVSRGAPRGANYNLEQRAGAAPA